MATRSLVFLLMLWPLLGFTVPASAATCTTPLIVTWEEWKPYTYREQDRLTGLDIELIHAVFAKAGCAYEFRQMPWKRTLRMLEQGEIDATASASFTEARAKFARYSLPYRTETVATFARQEDAAAFGGIESYDDIRSRRLRLVKVRGTFIGAEFDALQGGLDVAEMTHYRQIFKFLHAGRADIAVSDLFNGMTNIKDLNFGERLVMLPFRPATEPIHFMLSKLTTRAEDRIAIDAAIAALTADGTLKSIIDRYLSAF